MPLSPYEETLLGQQGTSDNPYAETLGLQVQSAESALRQSAAQAVDRSPERQAQVLKYAQKTGLPTSVVDRNFDQIRRHAETTGVDFARMVEDTPYTAAFYSNPENAAVAKDDQETLGTIEKYLKSLTGGAVASTGQALAGIGTLYESATRSLQSLTERAGIPVPKTPLPWWLNPSEILRRPGQELEALAPQVPETQRTFGTEVAAAIGQMVPLVAGSIVAGPEVSSVMFAGQGAEGMRERAAQVGAEGTPEADVAVTAGAGLGVLAGEFGLEKLLERVPPAIRNPFLRRLADVTISGGYQAGVQVALDLANNVASKLTINPNQELVGDLTRQAAVAGAAGAIARAVLGVGLPDIYKRVDQARQARNDGEALGELGATIQQSKTFQRLPEKLQDFILGASKDGPVEHVYIPTEDIQKYAQDVNIEPGELAGQLTAGGAKKYEEAVASGSDVQVPLSDYLSKIAPTDAAKAFNEAVRVGDPEAMNLREAAEFERQATAEPVQPEVAKVEESAARVREDIVGQLMGTGLPPSAVDAYAKLYEQAFRTMGQRAGVEPYALYEPYRLAITRPLPEILRNMPQGNTQLDTLIDRLRSGNRPTQQEMFGASLIEFLREKGGVKDEGGDLASREADAERRPFQRALINNKTGLPLDTAREAAAEAGYVPPGATVGEFLDAIDSELRGQPVYAQGRENPEAINQNVVLEQLDSYLKSREIDVKKASNAEIRKVLEQAAATGNIDAATGQVFEQPATELGLEKRGRILFGPNRQFNIELLDKADLSTFLHETGHFYLEVFGDLVDELRTRPGELADPQKQMVADYDALLKQFGVESRDKIGTEQHEQFARSFEAYLREGQAPAPELRSIFQRFAAWLTNIYRSLTQLKVELTPEVRGIFDRLLASDTEIERARQEAEIRAMIETQGQAERLGLSKEEYAAYGKTVQEARDRSKERLYREYVDEYNRASTEWFQARRREVHNQVAAEVHGNKDYIALAFLKDGTLPDGSALPEGVEPVKLDAAALEAAYGKHKDSTIMQALRKLDVYRREGGADPEQVAQLFGYSSADEMVQSLLKLRPMDAVIDAETTDRMRQTYGDMLTDGTAAEKAKDAVMTVGRSQVIAAEMKALARKVRETQPFVRLGATQERRAEQAARAQGLEQLRRFVPSVQLARSIAEQRIADMRVRDVRAGTYYVAGRRESTAAIEEVNAGRFDKALEHKQKELINVELYRAATEASKEIDKIREYMRSFDKATKRERVGKAGEDYLDQIDALRERYDFGRITNKQIERRKSLAAWATEQEAKGLPVEIPAEILNEARRQNYRDVTLQELRGLRDSIEMIDHLARLKNKLLKSQAKRELDAAVADMTTSIGDNAGKPPRRKFETRLPQDRLARTVASWFAAHRKLSSFLREMDGWKDGGRMWEYIMRPINDAANAEALENQKATRALAEIFDSAFAGHETELYKKTYLPEIGDSLSKMARIMVALNWGNEGNRQRVRDGFGWGEPQVQAILNTLEASDWKFVRDVWKFIDSYWGQISDKQQRVTGVRPEKVEASPFPTRFGEQPGGYFPIRYESQLSARAGSNLEGDFAESIKQASYVRATTRRGHTEARVQKVTEPVRLDFGVITEHVQQVIHDLTHHEMLIDVGRLLSNKQVQDSIYSHYGDVVYDQIKGAIRDVAWGNAPAPSWYRPLNALRQGVVTASLGWNLVTSALQPFQVSNAMVRVGPKWVIRGFTRWARNAASMESTAKWIQERSDFMRTRGETQFREINEIRNRVGLDRGRVSGWVHDTLHKLGVDAEHMPVIADSYFYLIQKAQQMADIPTWLGAYEKAMADPKNTEDRAVALADQAVIDSQASGHIKDLAAVERQPLLKLLTTFYSYNNLLFNQTFEVLKKKAPVGRKAIDAALLLFIPSAVAFSIHQLTGGRDEKHTAEQLVRQEIADLFGMMIGFRELSGPIQGYGYEGPAGIRYVGVVAKAGQQIGQGKMDESFWRSLNQAGGVLFHYPATQVQRTAEGFEALWEGKTRNPSALLFGPEKKK